MLMTISSVCFLLLTPTLSVPRLGFNVGTTFGGDDVVSDGQATMAYNEFAHVAFVLGHVKKTTFFFIQKDGQQQISGVTLYSDSPICSPYFSSTILISSNSLSVT